MVENPALMIGPWTLCSARPVRNGGAWVRSILDGKNGAKLGLVRRCPASGWWLWRRPATLDVRETDDESLVFTLHPPSLLSRAWSFYDAEEHCLGRWAGNQVVNGAGEELAEMQAMNSGGCFVDPHGELLASYEQRPEGGWRLHFALGVPENPFTRMALLGTLLAQDGVGSGR